jgi:hypothetical protein
MDYIWIINYKPRTKWDAHPSIDDVSIKNSCFVLGEFSLLRLIAGGYV